MSALGLALFAYMLSRAGLAPIADGLRHVGLGGFAAILVLSGIRLAVRSAAWTSCVPAPHRLSFLDALSSTVMGEALGQVTPLATLVSEPSKAVFVRHRLPLSVGLSTIVIENIFYTATVGMMIGLGAIAMLLEFPIPAALRWASLGSIAGMLVIVGGAFLLLRRGLMPATAVIEWLGARGMGGVWLAGQLDRVRRFETTINSFTSRNRERLGRLMLFEAGFHAAGVAEVYLTLALIAPDSVTLLKAVVLESVGRAINVLFKFVPMRVGVDEAGNALFAQPLGVPTPALVVLPLVRKARILTWTAIGLGLLVLRGLSIRGVMTEAETLEAQAPTRSSPASATGSSTPPRRA